MSVARQVLIDQAVRLNKALIPRPDSDGILYFAIERYDYETRMPPIYYAVCTTFRELARKYQ